MENPLAGKASQENDLSIASKDSMNFWFDQAGHHLSPWLLMAAEKYLVFTLYR